MDSARGFLMDGLQAELQPQKMLAVDFTEQLQHILRETIRTRADHQPLDFGIREDRFIFFTQLGDRRIGIRMVLKICQIACVRPFVRQQANLILDIRSKFAGAVVGAESTAADTLCAVAIRTGETAVDGKLDCFFSAFPFEPGIDRVITLTVKVGWRCEAVRALLCCFCACERTCETSVIFI